MFTRYSSINRHIISSSVVAGLMIALLAGVIQFSIFPHRRAVQFDTTISSLQNYHGFTPAADHEPV